MQLAFDPTRFKLRKRTGYNLIAARYKTAGGARAPVKNRMPALAELHSGQSLLEVASGPGMLARKAG